MSLTISVRADILGVLDVCVVCSLERGSASPGDHRALPSARRPLKLSRERATNTMNAIAELAIDTTRLEAEGYGEQFPVADYATEGVRTGGPKTKYVRNVGR
jgi:hypothetical protein